MEDKIWEDRFRALLDGDDTEEEEIRNPNTDVVLSFNLGEISQESKVLCELLADSPYAVNEQFQDSMMTKWMELRERTSQTSPDDPIMEERESLEAIQTICDKTLEALQQSFILKPKRPLENYSKDVLKMIMNLPTSSKSPSNDSTPLLDLPSASRALTEKALLIFLKHYYSLEWLEEFLFQELFTFSFSTSSSSSSSSISDFQDFLQSMRNFLLCIHLVHKTNPINPTAEFLAFFLTTEKYFLLKANEPAGAGSPPLANLWKRVAWSQTPLNRSLNYYSAKAEEARIAGFSLEIAYWQQMRLEKRQMEWTNGGSKIASKKEDNEGFFKSNKKANEASTSISPEVGIVRNVIIFSEDQRNANYFIQSCRAKASFYRTMDNENLELASVWEQTAVAFSKNDRNALQTFRIAWCLEKMNDPNYRPVWPLWRILLFQIRTQSLNLGLAYRSESPLNILKDIIEGFHNSNRLARHYRTKAEDEGSGSQIRELYKLAASHFTDQVKYLESITSSSFNEIFDEQLMTAEMIRSTIIKISDAYRRTLKKNFEDNLTQVICYIIKIDLQLKSLKDMFNLDASKVFISVTNLLNEMKQKKINKLIELENSLRQAWTAQHLPSYFAKIKFSNTEGAFLKHMENLFAKLRQLIDNSHHDIQFEKILLCFHESLDNLQESFLLARKQPGSRHIGFDYFDCGYMGDSIKSFTSITNKMLETGNDLYQFHKFNRQLYSFQKQLREEDFSTKFSESWKNVFDGMYYSERVIIEAFETIDPKRHAELFSCSSILFSAAINRKQAACSRLERVRDLYNKATDILLKSIRYSRGSFSLSSKADEMRTICEIVVVAAKLWEDNQEIKAKVKIQKAELLLERANENPSSGLISEERFKILMDFIDDPRMNEIESLEFWKSLKELCARKTDHLFKESALTGEPNQWDSIKLATSNVWRIVEKNLFETSCAALNASLDKERGSLDNLLLIIKATGIILKDFEVQLEYAKKEENMPKKMKKESEFRLQKWKELESTLATLSSSHLHSLMRFKIFAFWEIQEQLSESLTVAKKGEKPLKSLEECLIEGALVPEGNFVTSKWFLAKEKFKASIEKWLEAGEMERKVKKPDVAVHQKKAERKALKDLEEEANRLFLEGQKLLAKPTSP